MASYATARSMSVWQPSCVRTEHLGRQGASTLTAASYSPRSM